MANTKLPARLLDTSAVPTLNVTGTTTANGNIVVVGSEIRVQRPSGGSSYFGILMDTGEKVRLRNSYANKDIYFDRDGNLSIGVGNAADGAHFQHYQSSARHQSFQSTNGDLAIVTDNNTNPAVYIKGTGTADLVTVLDNTTEVFKIADGGKVGIGTTSSPAGLPLQTKVSSGDNKLRMTTANKDAFTLELKDATGDVHLGTNTTAGAIAISDNGNVSLLSNHFLYTNYIRGVGDNNTGINMAGSDVLELQTTGTVRMHLDNSGNVGIGTTPSGSKFHVVSSGSGVKGRFSDGTSETLDIGISSSSHAYLDQPNNGPILFTIGSGEMARVSSTGIAFPSGKGIDFSAAPGVTAGTSSVSGSVMKDYEYGSYTPVLSDYYGNAATYTGTLYGWYVKIGSFVQVWFKGNTVGVSGATGGSIFQVSLPYNIASGSTEGAGTGIFHGFAAGGYHYGALIIGNTNKVSFIGSNNNNGSWQWVTNAMLTGSTAFRASISYQAP